MRRFSLAIAACLCLAQAWAQQYSYSRDNKESDGFRWTLVEDGQGHYGALDSKGRLIVPLEFDMVMYSPSDGGFSTSLFADNSMGFYTQTGQCVLPNERGYDFVTMLENDAVGRYFEVHKGDYQGVCDGQGNEVVAPDRYENVGLYSNEGLPYFVVEQGGKYGACDASGREIIAPRYPKMLMHSEGNRFWYMDGQEMRYVTATRALTADIPFGKPSAPETETAGGYFTEEELAAVTEAMAGRKLKDGESVTVQLPPGGEQPAGGSSAHQSDFTEEIYRNVRNDMMGEIRTSIQQEKFLEAYGQALALLEDENYYPKDPDEQCDFSALLDEIKSGIMSDAMAATLRMDLGQYTALTSVWMGIQGWQQKLLIAAIGQGSQRAAVMLQALNAANGMGGGATPTMPGTGGNANPGSDYEPSLIQVEETCSLCHGTGQIRTQSVTTFGVRSEYVNETCPSCQGTGKVKHLRNNPRKGR